MAERSTPKLTPLKSESDRESLDHVIYRKSSDAYGDQEDDPVLRSPKSYSVTREFTSELSRAGMWRNRSLRTSLHN